MGHLTHGLSRTAAGFAARPRLLLGVMSATLAVYVGFVAVPSRIAGKLIVHGGYFYMAGLFALFVWQAVKLARRRREVWLGWLRRPGAVGLVLLAATLFAVWSDRFQHKVLFDEYVLQGTAYHMHATKEVATPVRAYDIGGTWLTIDTFLDKRPYFFAYLLSLVHDLTGFRTANVFALNVALTACFLALTFWIARQLTDRRAAMLAVVLLAGLPLLGQNATGAGMEVHNLAMIALTLSLAVLYLRAPDGNRLSLLCLSTVLLAQARYESVIYVVPVAAIILWGWQRAGRLILPWSAVITPLLLVPYAWHNRMVSETPILWQLHAGQTSRFSLEYLGGNLRSAYNFFFNTGPALANSWYLSVLGVLGLGVFGYSGVRWLLRRHPVGPAVLATVAIGAGVAANLGVLMFYYWSQLDEAVASRFALPACFMLALLAAVFVQRCDGRWPVLRAAFIGAGFSLLLSVIPAMAHRLYTSQNVVMQEIEWQQQVIAKRAALGPVLVISNHSTLPWLLEGIPAIVNGAARSRADMIRYHMGEGTFQEVIVAQLLRPTTPEGDFRVDSDEVLPASFRLEPFAEKRFGMRLVRLSRLVAIETSAPAAIPSVVRGSGPVTREESSL